MSASNVAVRPWLESTLAWLRQNAASGVPYSVAGGPASEPTALAALALAAHGDSEAARQAADWLARQQAADGSIGVRPGDATPGWPTSLALVAWQRLTTGGRYGAPIARGAAWLLTTKGTALEQPPELAHDTTLVGWSWAANTHSWLEPTALAVLALTAIGKPQHARTREAIRLLENRLLDSGGCNYGNTKVFGRELRAHVEPTGVVLLALAGQGTRSAKAAKAVEWLRSNVGPATPPASLGWALLGLRAQGALPEQADSWLSAAAARVAQGDNSPAKRALLALAAQGWETNG